MKLRILVALPVLVLALLSTALTASAEWNDASARSEQSPVLDNDGDTITDEIDFDDDNDGVLDMDDPEPFNPDVPGNALSPTPTQSADPAPTEPVTVNPPADSEPETPVEEAYVPAAPVVTALPSTGTGTEGDPTPAHIVYLLLLAAAGSAVIRLRIRSTT